jgi:hypothetical protein
MHSGLSITQDYDADFDYISKVFSYTSQTLVNLNQNITKKSQ